MNNQNFIKNILSYNDLTFIKQRIKLNFIFYHFRKYVLTYFNVTNQKKSYGNEHKN